MAEKIKRENLGNHLFEYQLSLIDKTVEDVQNNPNWLQEWKLTKQQYDEFQTYAIKTIKKILKCNTHRAKSAFAWFDLSVGLSVENEE